MIRRCDSALLCFPSSASDKRVSGTNRMYAAGDGFWETVANSGPRGRLVSSTWSVAVASSHKGGEGGAEVTFTCSINGHPVGRLALPRLDIGGEERTFALHETFHVPIRAGAGAGAAGAGGNDGDNAGGGATAALAVVDVERIGDDTDADAGIIDIGAEVDFEMRADVKVRTGGGSYSVALPGSVRLEVLPSKGGLLAAASAAGFLCGL